MKISFEIEEEELKDIIVLQIKQSSTEYFSQHKDTFVNKQVEKHVASLKNDGFFSRQVSSALSKAVYDKVNREFDGFIKQRLDAEIEKVIKACKMDHILPKLVEEKVKQKIKELLDKA